MQLLTHKSSLSNHAVDVGTQRQNEKPLLNLQVMRTREDIKIHILTDFQ